ncbi:MAG: hypothetical protein HKM89_01455 [Gemmatimonadales bacterium]|nr:hypothetical protein [Gemmatimonadales bacterium]
MKRLLTLSLAFALLAPAALAAQDGPLPGTIVLSFNKCDLDQVGYLTQLTDSAVVPIAQELVNEGKIFNYGMMTHSWGDEWNVAYYYVVENQQAFFDFWSEFVSRVSERHPNLFNEFQARCSEHKDSIYGHAAFTAPAQAPPM